MKSTECTQTKKDFPSLTATEQQRTSLHEIRIQGNLQVLLTRCQKIIEKNSHTKFTQGRLQMHTELYREDGKKNARLQKKHPPASQLRV